MKLVRCLSRWLRFSSRKSDLCALSCETLTPETSSNPTQAIYMQSHETHVLLLTTTGNEPRDDRLASPHPSVKKGWHTRLAAALCPSARKGAWPRFALAPTLLYSFEASKGLRDVQGFRVVILCCCFVIFGGPGFSGLAGTVAPCSIL